MKEFVAVLRHVRRKYETRKDGESFLCASGRGGWCCMATNDTIDAMLLFYNFCDWVRS